MSGCYAAPLVAHNERTEMDRKAAVKEWRDVARGAPDGVPTSRTVHEFAQRVEALAIAGCDKRHARLKTAALAILALAPDDSATEWNSALMALRSAVG